MSIDEEIERELTFEEDAEVDYNELSSFLSDYIRLGKDTGRIVTREGFASLDLSGKIIITLLTEHLRTQMDYRSSTWLTPDEISNVAKEDVSQVYPKIRSLEIDGLLENKEARYRIPAEKVDDAIHRIG